MGDTIENMNFMIGKGKYSVCATIVFCGNDMTITIGGGEKSHIGAVALAIPRNSLDNSVNSLSASASVFCLPGHKEDQLARDAALRFAAHFNCIVCVSLGMHIDNATMSDIEQLTANFQILLKEIEKL